MQDQYIPGVHNYCDRWCERCPFTAQCSVFAAEQELSDEAKDPTNPAFWENIKKNFEGILDMLNQKIAELGIELEENSERPTTKPDPELVQLAETMRKETTRYAMEVEDFFKLNAEFLEQHGNELAEQIEDGQPVDFEGWQFFQDAVDVIRWYQYFIPAKIDRAVSGLSDRNELEDSVQSDANGSAKIAIIALERSLGAWEVACRRLPEKADDIRELQHQLQQLRLRMTDLFPDWRFFHRPGFDDKPGSTIRLDFNPN